MKIRLKVDMITDYKGKNTTVEAIREEFIKESESASDVFLGVELSFIDINDKVVLTKG